MRFLREFTMQTYRTIQQQFLISFFYHKKMVLTKTFFVVSFQPRKGPSEKRERFKSGSESTEWALVIKFYHK